MQRHVSERSIFQLLRALIFVEVCTGKRGKFAMFSQILAPKPAISVLVLGENQGSFQ
jgi:hypothetical protein